MNDQGVLVIDDRLHRSTVLPMLVKGVGELSGDVAEMLPPVCVVACFVRAAKLGEPLSVQLTGDDRPPTTVAEIRALLDSLPPGTTVAWFRTREAP